MSEQLFNDPLHERLGNWPLGYIPYGGPDYGEILAIARAVGDGDDSDFHRCWSAAADRMVAEAETSLARGHSKSARELLLRAACCYGKACHPLFGAPVDERLRASYRKQIATFERALAMGEVPVTPVRIPYEGTSMPAYLLPAEGGSAERRPLLIVNNGYDASVTDQYFAIAVAASRRGYHCLFFDGPGQGEMLIEQGLPMRPDWEAVIGPVVDYALGLPQVDPKRVALYGWSLGGYLAPRAASAEHRLAACIADPGQADIADGFRGFVMKLGVPSGDAARLGDLDPAVLDRMAAIVEKDRTLHWSVIKRGFWVNGASNLRDYLREVESFTMAGRIDQIRCPTLFTLAEGDPLSAGTQAFFDALQCEKKLIRFSAEDGAEGHCEMFNRSLLNRRVLDWLDEVLVAPAA